MTQLLKKNAPFVWTRECTTAFEAFKQALVTTPILALPNFSKQFTIETDATDYGVSAVLQQDRHPLAFPSKPLGQRNKGLSTY